MEKGSLGFIEWMLSKSGLSNTRKNDLEAAKTVIEKAEDENYSNWYHGMNNNMPEDRNDKVVVLGDEKDATSLTNTKKMFEVLREINQVRANDENYAGSMQRDPALTNFYVMAIAQTGADRGAGTGTHTLLQISCENLAFSPNPVRAWCSEKTSFDSIRDKLGISAPLADEAQLEKIDDYANGEGIVIGHYTNLFWAIDQIMGVGFTDYSKKYSYGTWCYNATKASNYSGKYASYTIDEFEALFDDYYSTVDVSSYLSGLEDAQKAYDKAKEERTAKRTAYAEAVADLDGTEKKISAYEQAIKEAEERLSKEDSSSADDGSTDSPSEPAVTPEEPAPETPSEEEPTVTPQDPSTENPQESKPEDTPQPASPEKPALGIKSLWASQHSVGKVKFKWSKKDGVTDTGWNLKYRMRRIGGNNTWSGWTTKAYPARTYEAWITIPKDYVIEIHAQAKGDKTWSTGIITTPAGGKYQAMKTAHVVNAKNGRKLTERAVNGSAIAHTTLNLRVGQEISVKPDYEYPVKDFKKRPRLYPSHMLYDIGDKSMISITKPDGSKYTGGIIDGTATIKATKAGKTTIIFRSPNGRTMIADVTITK